jgi:integrase
MSGYASSTRKVYDSWILRLQAFAQTYHVKFAIPVPPQLLHGWLGALALQGKAASIGSAVAAVAFFHKLHDYPSPIQPNSLIQAALKAAARTPPLQPRDIDPVPKEMMAALATDDLVRQNDEFDLRDKALIFTGWMGALRVGELASLRICHVRKADSQRWSVIIARSKTDQAGQGYRTPLAGLDSDRFAAGFWLSQWLATRFGGLEAFPAELPHPLHCLTCPFLWSTSTFRNPPSGRAVANIVKSWAVILGFQDIKVSGSSLRSGAVTAMLEQHVSPHQVAYQGRWTSTAMPLNVYNNPSEVDLQVASAALVSALHQTQVIPCFVWWRWM